MKWIVAPIAWPLMFIGLIGVALWMAAGGDDRCLIEINHREGSQT